MAYRGNEEINEIVRHNTPVGGSFSPPEPLEPPAYHRTVHIYCKSCGHREPVELMCGDRLCPSCREKQFSKLRMAWLPVIKRVKGYLDSQEDVLTFIKRCRGKKKIVRVRKRGLSWKFLTLTTKNFKASIDKADCYKRLRAEVTRINKAFSRLQRWKRYSRVLLGGVKVCEIVFHKGGSDHVDRWDGTKEGVYPYDTWNVHLHILVFGDFQQVCCQEMKDCNDLAGVRKMEREKCSLCISPCWRRDWKKVSRSTVLDIKYAGQPGAALKYCLAYMGKVPDVAGNGYVYNKALKGLHLFSPFGLFWGLKREHKPKVCQECRGEDWLSEFQIESVLLQKARAGLSASRARVRRGPPALPGALSQVARKAVTIDLFTFDQWRELT